MDAGLTSAISVPNIIRWHQAVENVRLEVHVSEQRGEFEHIWAQWSFEAFVALHHCNNGVEMIGVRQ
jgi:hypothetical protein